MPARAPGQGRGGVGGWLSALRLYLPLPVIGYLGWLVTLLVLRGRASRQNAVAAANVRHGLNWCLTYGAVWLAWFAVYPVPRRARHGRDVLEEAASAAAI
ncbi:hypothetical protein USB125703_00100 [Pseudoclavibacter triregionum]|nr:hypothetical protein USB125703_00100 [Pseudoclavibacter triregionum]